MALNIGTLVGYLQLDDTNFARKADAADRKINALKLHLEALAKENPKISVEVATQTAELDSLKAKLADLKAQAASGADVRVDAVQALIEIDRVQARIRELHGKTITVDADTSPAERKLRSLNGLWTTILGLGPTVVPIAGAAALGIGAIGAAALSAAGAVGVLKAAFAGMGSAISAYGSYQSAIAKATATRQAAIRQATSPAQRQAANVAFQKSQTVANATLSASQYGQLGPQGQKFARFAGRLLAPGGAVFRLRSAAQESVLPGVTAGIKGALPALPGVIGAEKSIGGAVGGELEKGLKSLKDPFWQHFFSFLGKEAPKDIRLFGSIFGNVIQGVIRGLERFAPDGRKMLTWVDDSAKKFKQWTAGKGFESFMATVHQDGGAVAKVLAPLVQILPGILSGLNTTGLGELNTMGLILQVIAKLPTGVIEFLAQTLPLVVLGMKAITLATKLWTAAQAAWNFVMDANPIMLIVLGLVALAAIFIYAYKHSETFRNIVNGALRAVGAAGKWLWEHALHPAFDGIVAAIKVLGKWGMWLWNNVFQPVFKFIARGVSTLLSLWAGMVGALSHVPGFRWLGGLASALQGAADKANGLADAINKIPTHKQSTVSIDVVRTVHGVTHNTGGHTPVDPSAPLHRAMGGWAFGPGTGTSDSIPARLSDHEFVVRRAQAVANAPLVEAINRSNGPLRAGDYVTPGRRSKPAGPIPFVITNWETGVGFMHSIASSEDEANHRHAMAIAGME